MMVERIRRAWPDEIKCQIVDETYQPGASVSQVARRHDVNANLLFAWRRDKRFNPRLSEPDFLPVTLEAEPVPVAAPAPIASTPKPEKPECSAQGTLEVTLPCRSRMVCHGSVDTDLVREVLAGLKSRG